MKFKFKHIFLCPLLTVSIFISLNQNLFAYPAEVESISSRDYYPAVKEAIDKAENSIHMSMFVVALRPSQKDSVVYKLCNALIEAKKRGVDVRIILDQNVNFYDEKAPGEIEGKNEEAYQYLTSNGIDVFFDNKYQYTHSKALVIDEEIVIIGSTNWSYSALEKNNESSVLIRSPELASTFIEIFSEIETDNFAKELPFNADEAVIVDKTFLTNKELAGRMITKQDERAMDLYLLLLYLEKPEEKISFNFSVYAKYLDIDYMKPVAYRRQLSKSLRKLNEVYDLLEAEFFYGRNARVKLLGIKDQTETYKIPETNYFLLPEEYFEYGWNKVLSHRAKYCYLINLYKSQERYGRSWSLSRPEISKMFNLAPETITPGMNELRSMNLIEIEYSSIEEGYDKRSPARYRLNKLFSPSDNEQAIQKLAEKYGDKFKTARKYAKIVFEENDPVVIEEIINLILEYPDRIVKDAYKYVGKKAKDNPKRNQYYAVAVIRDQGDK